MVFVEVIDVDPASRTEMALGLVFKPDKIEGYNGEALSDLGLIVGLPIPSVEWDTETLKVTSVSIHHASPPRAVGS
jgi:hypothetical protein